LNNSLQKLIKSVTLLHESLIDVMRISNSLLQNLIQACPQLRPQIYFKATLTALSHAIEDLVLAGTDSPLVIANFQQERYYRQEAHRYGRIAARTDQVYVLAAPDSDFIAAEVPYETIALNQDDGLVQEWHLIVVGQKYSACLICREHASPIDAASLDQSRQFRGIWTFERQVSLHAAQLMLEQILSYRPDLASKVLQAQQACVFNQSAAQQNLLTQTLDIDPRLFADRLMTYLQSSQYKLLKAYRTISGQEQRQRLIHSISTALRCSLNLEEILRTTVTELGRVFSQCRCVLYRYDPVQKSQPIEYESFPMRMLPLQGHTWALAEDPLFWGVLSQNQTVAIADITQDLSLRSHSALKEKLNTWQIKACLLIPICYQNQALGVLELHQPNPHLWVAEDIALVEAIATQAGVALMQAQAYRDLEGLNLQLTDLERNQRNLIAIVGHELRTPLSTIQVCLESLSSMPQTPPEIQQVMLESALNDAGRLRKLIQDFLTLSRLEGGLMRWNIEPISLQDCLDLVLSSLKNYGTLEVYAPIILDLPPSLPLIQADGDGLVEVLTKLLDNARKFTPAHGEIMIQADVLKQETISSTAAANTDHLEIVIKDTGRGIEVNQLETIFDQFYQEEGFLQRTVGGTGLGLAICRRIIQRLGGKIWAISSGKDRGSEFHFTLPLASPPFYAPVPT
jgi:DICT domain-containing protein/signal transduction histidine kinase